MSLNLFTVPPPTTPIRECIQPPLLTGNKKENIAMLKRFDKKTLLLFCEQDTTIFNLCNEDPQLNRIITAPSFLH